MNNIRLLTLRFQDPMREVWSRLVDGVLLIFVGVMFVAAVIGIIAFGSEIRENGGLGGFIAILAWFGS